MFKKKNLVPLLLLIITGFFGFRAMTNPGNSAQPGQVMLPGQIGDEMRDAVADRKASAPGLTMPSMVGDELRDAVAASPALENRGDGNGPQGPRPAENPAAPRGGSDGNGGTGGPGPGAELPGGQPTPNNISPTGPPQPE